MDGLPRDNMLRTDTSPHLWSHEICITLRCSFKNTLELIIPATYIHYMNIYSCNILKIDGLPREDILKTDTSPYLWSHETWITLRRSFKNALELMMPTIAKYYMNIYSCNMLKIDHLPRKDILGTDT